MANGDPWLNCVCQVCCDATAAHESLVKNLLADDICSEADAKKVATWIQQHFDLAEKGTLQPLKDSIARLARG